MVKTFVICNLSVAAISVAADPVKRAPTATSDAKLMIIPDHCGGLVNNGWFNELADKGYKLVSVVNIKPGGKNFTVQNKEGKEQPITDDKALCYFYFQK